MKNETILEMNQEMEMEMKLEMEMKTSLEMKITLEMNSQPQSQPPSTDRNNHHNHNYIFVKTMPPYRLGYGRIILKETIHNTNTNS